MDAVKWVIGIRGGEKARSRGTEEVASPLTPGSCHLSPITHHPVLIGYARLTFSAVHARNPGSRGHKPRLGARRDSTPDGPRRGLFWAASYGL